jgi:DUF1365 family protein
VCQLSHVRTAPFRHAFTYRTYLWLVDLDRMPRPAWWLRPLVGFTARDHLGDPGRTIRTNVDDFLAGHGVHLDGGRILMLAHAPVFGYVFNPLTLYWCHRPSTTGALVRTALRHPLSTWLVSARIRRHGVALYLRGLPVQPRPASTVPEVAP